MRENVLRSDESKDERFLVVIPSYTDGSDPKRPTQTIDLCSPLKKFHLLFNGDVQVVGHMKGGNNRKTVHLGLIILRHKHLEHAWVDFFYAKYLDMTGLL